MSTTITDSSIAATVESPAERKDINRFEAPRNCGGLDCVRPQLTSGRVSA